MALIHTFPESPADRAYFRKIDSALTVFYTRKLVPNQHGGSWGSRNYANEYHRYARKRYRYVGMDDDAKDACVEAMTALYTRECWDHFWNGTQWQVRSSGQDLLATITPVGNDDGSWDVQIDVNEDAVRYTEANNSYPAKSRFSAIDGTKINERLRTYDGEEEPD